MLCIHNIITHYSQHIFNPFAHVYGKSPRRQQETFQIIVSVTFAPTTQSISNLRVVRVGDFRPIDTKQCKSLWGRVGYLAPLTRNIANLCVVNFRPADTKIGQSLCSRVGNFCPANTMTRTIANILVVMSVTQRHEMAVISHHSL